MGCVKCSEYVSLLCLLLGEKHLRHGVVVDVGGDLVRSVPLDHNVADAGEKTVLAHLRRHLAF